MSTANARSELTHGWSALAMEAGVNHATLSAEASTDHARPSDADPMPESQTKTVLCVDAAPWFGGAQRSLLSLLLGLRATPWRPVLLAADDSNAGLLASCEAAHIETHRISARHWQRTVRGLWHLLVDRRRFRAAWRSALAASPPDIVHANGPRAALLVVGAVPARVPLVVHIRDVRVPRIVQRLVARRASRLIAISTPVADTWRRAAGAGRLDVVYNGLDIDTIQRAVPVERPDPGDGLLVVSVADMVEWKRHELFLEAVAKASARSPKLSAVVVGRALTPAGNAYLRRLQSTAAALGLAHRVEFVTNASNALPWIAAADVLVSAAEAEPFGRTVVEALALGKPVVVTTGWGPQEIVGNCAAGLVTEPLPDAIADAILSWSDAAKREAVAASARSRAEMFRCERMVEGVCKVFTALTDVPTEN